MDRAVVHEDSPDIFLIGVPDKGQEPGSAHGRNGMIFTDVLFDSLPPPTDETIAGKWHKIENGAVVARTAQEMSDDPWGQLDAMKAKAKATIAESTDASINTIVPERKKLLFLARGIEILDAARAAGNRPLSAEEEAVRAQLLAALVPIKGLHAAEDDSIAQIEAATTEADLFALFP
jgi:hypothetical protein